MELAAVLRTSNVDADIHIRTTGRKQVKLTAIFRKIPPGEHGFHIHNAGDLRGEGCVGACSHFHVGPSQSHGGGPTSSGERHTGDLGNIGKPGTYSFTLKGITAHDLVGRSIILHAEADDLGKGPFEDSLTTGHSGARIACGVLGRVACKPDNKTRKRRK